MSLVPKFARVEIRMTDRRGLNQVSLELERLSARLSLILLDGRNSDEAAKLLAYDEIKATSQKLRKGN